MTPQYLSIIFCFLLLNCSYCFAYSQQDSSSYLGTQRFIQLFSKLKMEELKFKPYDTSNSHKEITSKGNYLNIHLNSTLNWKDMVEGCVTSSLKFSLNYYKPLVKEQKSFSGVTLEFKRLFFPTESRPLFLAMRLGFNHFFNKTEINGQNLRWKTPRRSPFIRGFQPNQFHARSSLYLNFDARYQIPNTKLPFSKHVKLGIISGLDLCYFDYNVLFSYSLGVFVKVNNQKSLNVSISKMNGKKAILSFGTGFFF